MKVARTGLKKNSMMKLTRVKLPRMMNIEFQPKCGTIVLSRMTPKTAEKPKPVKKSALTFTPRSVPYTCPASGGNIDCYPPSQDQETQTQIV